MQNVRLIEKFLNKSNILHTPIYFIFSNFNRIGQFVETRKPKYPIGYCLSTQNDLPDTEGL